MEQKSNTETKYPRHPKAHPQGGVHLKDQAAKVKEVGLNILKTMGVKIKEEGIFDLLKISRPAIISYPKTYLECVAGDYYYTEFMNKAASATTPLERLKWVLAGVHRNSADMQNNGPLNPILGETYIAEKKDGTTLCCEQISHHPPVSAYLLIGPNKSYKLYGTGELEVKMNGFNNIIGRRIGKTTIEFPDGGRIVYANPDTRIDGLLVGDRRYNYVKSCVFLDKRNKLSAEVNFLYDETGTISKITSSIKKLFWGKQGQSKPPTDMFEVVFFNIVKQDDGEMKKDVLCEGSGSWLSHIQINNDLCWKFDQSQDDPWIEKLDNRLFSDSLFREDSKFIKIKDFDRAQKEKDNLENKQRYDAKLRKDYQEKMSQGRSQANMEVQK